MRYHGIEVQLLPGESLTNARSRTIRERYEELNKAIQNGELPLYIKKPEGNDPVKVVGLGSTRL